MESNHHWLISIGLVTSSVIAVTANFFLLLVFCRRRGLRTVPNRFVINLLITNLLSSILLIPLLLVDQDVRPTVQTAVQQNETDVSDVIIRDDARANIEIIQTRERILGAPHADSGQNCLCYFAQGITSFVCTASIFSILLIGVNQYFGVIHSLRYHFYINKCRATLCIGVSWFIALFCAILSALTYSDGSVWHFCEERKHPGDTTKILNTTFALGYFFLVILAPFVAICVIYGCIYSAAHQNSERMRRSTSAPLTSCADYMRVPLPKCAVTKERSSFECGAIRELNSMKECSAIREQNSLPKPSATKGRSALPKVHSAPNFFNIDKEQSFKDEAARSKVVRTCSDRIANNFINNLRHKISNASVFRYREETRAAKISFLVILMVMVCYIPYGLTLVLSSECVKVNSSQIFNYLSLVLLVFSNILSPFLFGYRNKRVKREICKMFGLLPKQRMPFGERPKRLDQMENPAAQDPLIHAVPQVVVTCKAENERKSILKRVCTTGWSSYKKCNFITVPDSCISGEARGSFSSASTQMSTEE